jgi:hypothetical protein
MLLCVLSCLAACKNTIPKFISGNWSGGITYSSDALPDHFINFTIKRNPLHQNNLETTFSGEPVMINLSSRNLSGSLTYRSQSFGFDFVELVKPFVSSDINLGEFGAAHCIFASLSGIRCTYVSARAGIFSFMFKKTADQTVTKFTFVRKHWKKLTIIAVCLTLRFFFKRWSERMAQNEKLKQNTAVTAAALPAPADEKVKTE